MIEGQIVCQDYQIVSKIAQGSFGFVYKVKNRTTHELYALKTDEKSITKMQLENQIKTLKLINQMLHKPQSYRQSLQNKSHFVDCLQYYLSENSSNMMIMPLFGENIYELNNKCHKRFDSQTIYQVAVEMLKAIQRLHRIGYIHRDIKPQNFVVGNYYQKGISYGDNNIHLIDFGLAKSYFQIKQNGNVGHIQYSVGKRVRGTPMYLSINILLGIEPSTRDDLQSLMYVLILLLKGRLPWSQIKITKNDLNQLTASKILTKPEDLFLDLPIQLKDIFLYIRMMKFQEIPNYNKIYKAFQSILTIKKKAVQQMYRGKYHKYCWQTICTKEQLI